MPSEVMSMQEPDNPVIPGPGLLSTGRYIHFGPFRIDQQRQEVTRNGARLKLQGKVYQTLLTLLEKPGEVVTREELRARLWPADTHVNYDANVNTTVNKLRMALGDSSDKPLYHAPLDEPCLLASNSSPGVPCLSHARESLSLIQLASSRAALFAEKTALQSSLFPSPRKLLMSDGLAPFSCKLLAARHAHRHHPRRQPGHRALRAFLHRSPGY